MDLRQQLLDIFQATSLLIVFVTVLFGLRYQVIIADLNSNVPNGESARKREKSRLIKSLFMNIVFQIILLGSTAYMFLPMAVRIIMASGFRIYLWNFDFLQTAYVLISVWLWAFFSWILWLTVRMVKKILSIL